MAEKTIKVPSKHRRVRRLLIIPVLVFVAVTYLGVTGMTPAHAAPDPDPSGSTPPPLVDPFVPPSGQRPDTSSRHLDGAPDAVDEGDDQLDEAKVQETATAAAAFVSDLATHSLTSMFRWLDVNTAATVNQRGSWFVAQYGLMAQVGIWVLLPLLLVSLIQAVAKGSLRQAIMSAAFYMPISILGTVVAVEVIQLLLTITDELASVFFGSFDANLAQFGLDLINGFANGGNQAPWFVTLILGLLMIAAAFSMLFILVMREACIYMGTLFLPIMFAMLVWPYTAKYFRGLVEFLVSMIFSKLVIVAALSLAVAGLASAQGISNTTPNGVLPDGTQVVQEAQDTPLTGSMQWFAEGMGFIGMLFVASFSPWMLKGVIGHIGMSETGAIVTTALTRTQAQPVVHGINRYYWVGTRGKGLLTPRPPSK